MDKVLIIAFITEALWETIKMIKEPKGINLSRLGAMLLGILVAVAAGIDIFAILGMELGIKYLGSVITGLLISRGSNLVHDLLSSINSVSQTSRNRANGIK
jgi:hypothetical protein